MKLCGSWLGGYSLNVSMNCCANIPAWNRQINVVNLASPDTGLKLWSPFIGSIRRLKILGSSGR